MEIFRTPQRMVSVRVLLEDSRRLQGDFYVPATGLDGNHGRLLDRLNDASEKLLPLAGKHETLLNKACIVAVELASGHQQAEGVENEIAREQRVRVTLAQGKTVERWLRFFMPEELGRLLDYLNEAPPFIAVVGEQRVTLVHRCFIQSVQELTGISAVK
ncbi:MAG: hypothetical protein BMS9Abin10_0887 [Gammaproteobacteria bacterium]|nr:MAG: hypothetical protein BMS9Abin10_0887 [Gammaproteobacteria bacterium]